MIDTREQNTQVINAIKALKPDTRKRTNLWNREHSKGAGIVADEAYQIRSSIWVIINDDILFLFIGDVKVAVGRSQVLKTLVDYVF